MDLINYNSLRFSEYLDKLNPNNSGIFFSILFHLIILLFAVGLPNFFGPKDVFIPNVIPVEILNVAETTNIEKSETKDEDSQNTASKQKKFNSSSNIEIQKQFDVKQNNKTIESNEQSILEIKQKTNQQIEEKKIIEVKQKQKTKDITKVETIKSDKIKPKIKPQFIKEESNINKSDIQIDKKDKIKNNNNDQKIDSKPKTKPKEDFSIASMLKDLRNEKSNNVIEEDIIKEEKKQTGDSNENKNMILSITEIDLLRQQLSSCWNAPAGAVINVGDKVTISAKVQQNMKVFQNSVRIVDTNISKSNPFYGPITDSAMRTLLNPECTPLKLPKNKYDLWKNLTITFDYSIMKGY